MRDSARQLGFRWRPPPRARTPNAAGATGYYRPEDLQEDPDYTGPGVRFCVANTGNAGSANFGEVLCAVDSEPKVADPARRTVVINRFFEGDGQLKQPDNIEFQPGSGVVYVIEDASFGDIWACLPDGDDRDIKSDGCVRAISLRDRTAERLRLGVGGDGTQLRWLDVRAAGRRALARVCSRGVQNLCYVRAVGSRSAGLPASSSSVRRA